MDAVKIKKLGAIVFGLFLSQTASALTINSGETSVGALDKFLASEALGNSGDDEVLAWVGGRLDYLGYESDGLTLEFKTEGMDSRADEWSEVDGQTNDVRAFALEEPVYFYLLKLGVPKKSGADTHYLFDNQESLLWAVIDFDEMLSDQPDGFSFNLGRISHISGFDSVTDVAEPGTLGLFGLGLLAFGAMRRRAASHSA